MRPIKYLLAIFLNILRICVCDALIQGFKQLLSVSRACELKRQYWQQECH